MSRKSSAPSVSFFAFQDIITSVVGIFVLITLIMVVQLAVKATDRLSSKSPVADNLSSIVALMQSEVDELKKRETELETVSSSVAGVQQFNIEEIRMDLEKEVKQLEERTKRFEAMHESTRSVMVAAEGQLQRLQEESIANQPKQEELKNLLEKMELADQKLSNLQTEDPMVFRDASLSGKELVVVDIANQEIGVLDLSRKDRAKFTGIGRIDRFQKWIPTSRVQSIHFLLLVRPGATSTFQSCRDYLERINASYGFDVIGNDQTLKMREELEEK
jgi:hypothetical protein